MVEKEIISMVENVCDHKGLFRMGGGSGLST